MTVVRELRSPQDRRRDWIEQAAVIRRDAKIVVADVRLREKSRTDVARKSQSCWGNVPPALKTRSAISRRMRVRQ